MAQLLVLQRNNEHSDPNIDRRDCYKFGDVIAVQSDDHMFGAAELQHPFSVVSVEGNKSHWLHLLDSEPATLKDKYPRSMMKIKRLQIPMMKEIRGATRVARKNSVDLLGNVTRKNTGGV